MLQQHEENLQKLQLQKNVEQLQHYNILLFGETGSGKSTLINYLANYFLGGSLGNLKIAIETPYLKATERWKSNEKDINDRKKRKTSECTVYDFTKDSVRYNFIDTPGLSDTEWTDQDYWLIKEIISFAEKTGRLSAIITVINGTVARARNITNHLNRLSGSVPDVYLNNLVVVLTNCDLASANFDVESLEPKVPKDNIFYMNNSALSKPVKDWKDNRKLMKIISDQWQTSMDEIGGIINRINQLGHIATSEFREMRLKREQIMADIHGMWQEVKKLEKLQFLLQYAIDFDVQTEIQYSNYKQTKEVEYEVLEPADYCSTICASCSKVCHFCGVENTSNLGADIFMFVTYVCFFNKLHCRICGCHYGNHYRANLKLVKKSKSVEDTLHEVKALEYGTDTHGLHKPDLRNIISKTDVEAVQLARDRKETKLGADRRTFEATYFEFNFEAELQSVINIIKLRLKTITSVDARETKEREVDSMIENITYLAQHHLSQSHRSSCASESGEDATPDLSENECT